MKFALIILCMLLFAFMQTQAQTHTKLPLEYILNQRGFAPDEPVHLFLKGDESELRQVVAQLEGHFKYMRGKYAAATIAYEKVALLDAFPEVEAVHFSLAEGHALLNQSRQHTRTDQVHSGTAGFVAPYTGAGVIVGFVDVGLDLAHADFRHADGTTRVLELWDQTLSNNALTPSYGYGRVYDSAMINAGQCPHIDQPAYFGHGTNTTGIAVGNGLEYPEFTGHAPDADIIVVSSKMNAAGWTATVADAVDFIFERAEFYGKPCVINASVGTYAGAHDGRDIPAQMIADKIAETQGRVMVCAAGNSGEVAPYHLGYTATPTDTNFTWFKTQSGAAAGNGYVAFDAYGDVGEMEGLRFAIGADRTTPTYQFRGATPFDSITNLLGTVTAQNLMSASGNYLGHVTMLADSANGTYHLQVVVDLIDSVAYLFRFMVTGMGSFDLWSSSATGTGSDMVSANLPTAVQFPPIAHYKLPDGRMTIVDSWACSERVITVGSFTNRTSYVNYLNGTTTFPTLITGQIATLSSAGPSRTGLVKPDVAAPGQPVLTAGAAYQIAAQLGANQADRVAPSGKHHRAGGTSSASPAVAGIAALFFEMCPNASWGDFKAALTGGAVADNFTSTTPNDHWGYGKADAVNTLNFHKPALPLSYADDELCEGSTAVISVPSGFENYLWNNGDTTRNITVSQGGVYYVTAANAMGCEGSSDTLILLQRPVPNKPVIEVVGNNPTCANEEVILFVEGVFGAYTWSNGAHTNAITVATAGTYTCEVQNIYRCANTSDAVAIAFYPAYENPALHHQAGNVLRAFHDSIPLATYEWFLNDSLVASGAEGSYTATTTGAWRVKMLDTNGCRWPSQTIFIHALGIGESEAERGISVFPNPARGELNITSNAGFRWWFEAMTGQRVLAGTSNSGTEKIGLNGLAKGIYLLQVEQGGTIVRERIVVE